MRISVFGLGYVGCVSVACLARNGHRVVGVDVVDSKVDSMNEGRPTVVEPGIDAILAEAHRKGLVSATLDAVDAVAQSDVSLVCVGTPGRPDGTLDLTCVANSARQIGMALARKSTRHLVVLRSTVPPGTVENLVIHEIAQAAGPRGARCDVLIVPEFLRECSAVADYLDPPLVVAGNKDGKPDDNAAAVAELLAVDAARIRWVRYREAELLKAACNTFHALKVAFANEVGALCSALSIDGISLMQHLCEDRKLNISAAYLNPGFPFGGSCLPKDLQHVVALGHQLGVHLPLLSSIGPSNEEQKKRLRNQIHLNGYLRIGLDGLAFKPLTDDLRESPLVELAEYLIGKGCDLKILDPAVDTARLKGANREYVENHIPHLASRLVSTSSELLEHSEVVLLTRSHGELVTEAAQMAHPPLFVDLARSCASSHATSTNHHPAQNGADKKSANTRSLRDAESKEDADVVPTSLVAGASALAARTVR
jgi:GDP-mannose 6-dehydrogenase